MLIAAPNVQVRDAIKHNKSDAAGLKKFLLIVLFIHLK